MTFSVAPYAHTSDGQIINTNASWSTLRAATTGTVQNGGTSMQCRAYEDTGTYGLRRCFLAFDTSGIPDDAEILSAVLSVYVTAKSGTSPWCLVESTAASGTALDAADFDNVGSTEFATRKTQASITASAYNTFTLNASGLAAISKTGYTKLALRIGYDLDNSAPGTAADSDVTWSSADASGTSQDPYLTVTYALVRTASDAWAWSDAATKGDGIEGGHAVYGRTTSDSWAWSDVAARRSPPAARTAIGSRVAVFTSNGSAGTFGAHYAFGCTIALPDGKTLMCIATKGDMHSSYNTSLVMKTSTDDGVTWSSESTVIDERPSWGWRDPYAVVLSSGRIAITGGRPQDGGGYTVSTPPFIYSDDNGATWSTPVLLNSTATGTYRNTYGSDIVELANGDLLLVGYGQHSDGSNTYDVCVSKSTDDGATWTYLSTPALYSTYGYNCVEPQAELLSNGDIYLTFHTEDGLPTDWYRTRSQDSGATWTTPVKVGSGDSFNRQGLSAFADDRLIVSANLWSGFGFGYYESYNGNLFGSAVTVDTNQPVASYTSNLWIMVTALGGTGESQNVGFTYGAEVGSQDKASIWWRQFTGTDGVSVFRRAASDSWAWSDSASRSALSFARSVSDTWAWSDTATRTTVVTKTTSDSWAWSDAAVRSVPGSSQTTSDTWAWSDTATRAAPKSRTTADSWPWVETPGADVPTPLFWLRARRRSAMSAPTKTYVQVQAKGTTRTATWTSPTYKAPTEAGILVVLDVTAASGTGGLTLRINAHDQASSQAVALNAAPTAVTATGTTSYALYPFGAVSGNVTQATEFYLPAMFSITVTHGDSSSYTYSLGYCLLP